MALQLGALRSALLDAGATPEKADKASEELAGYDVRLASIDAQLLLLKWMVGTNLGLSVAMLWRVFHP